MTRHVNIKGLQALIKHHCMKMLKTKDKNIELLINNIIQSMDVSTLKTKGIINKIVNQVVMDKQKRKPWTETLGVSVGTVTTAQSKALRRPPRKQLQHGGMKGFISKAVRFVKGEPTDDDENAM